MNERSLPSPNEGPPRTTVLVIEDDLPTRRSLLTMLEQHGYTPCGAASARAGMELFFETRPGVVLLDLGLPDGDGMQVLAKIREWGEVPVIVVSARGKEDDQICALDAGASDYVVKPLRSGELLARIRVALRYPVTNGRAEIDPTSLGELRIRGADRAVFMGEREVNLTPTEYKMLIVLVRHAGRVVTHRQLLREVWGDAYVEQVQYVRVYMKNLRQKLEDEPARPRYLLTAPGVGYRFTVPES
jgi:two-component system KDP operon response regulator KdpE